MARLSWLFTPFRRLQWRLTFSYTLVSAGALLVVELLLFALVLYLIGSDILSNLMVQAMQNELAPAARIYLAQTPPDVDGLQAWADSLIDTQTQFSPSAGVQETTSLRLAQLRLNDAEQQLYVLGPDLTLLAQTPERAAAVGEMWQAVGFANGTAVLQEARAGYQGMIRGDDGAQLIALPVLHEESGVVGILVLVFRIPIWREEILTPILQSIAASLIPITVATGLIGALFGFLTARGLTRRIGQITAAADAWSQGDFSVVARDDSGDELGHLSRRLNRMAEQLQNLLETRQELAAVEERNRLARELHDAVTQSLYSITLFAEANRRFAADENFAMCAEYATRLGDTAQQALREMRLLVHNLRPSILEQAGLIRAIQQRLDGVERRTGIQASLQAHDHLNIPAHVEEALYHITQEALNNALKHAVAGEVTVSIAQNENWVQLCIADNGRGFDIVHSDDSGGLGLISMRERVELLGGSLKIKTAVNQGTVITVNLNLKKVGEPAHNFNTFDLV